MPEPYDRPGLGKQDEEILKHRESLLKEATDTTEYNRAKSPGIWGTERPSGSLLDHLFTYHSPTLDQVQNYAAIRSAARYFAQVLIDNTPGGADQSAAIRKLRECVMTANASVALRGRS